MGNHENTEIGNFLAKYLDVDINDATKRLQSAATWSAPANAQSVHKDFAWMGDPQGSDVRMDGLDSYHGDYKKRSLAGCGCGGLH